MSLAIAITALTVISWAAMGALIPLDRWLTRRATYRAVITAAEYLTRTAAARREQLLHRLAEAAQDDQDPTP